MCIFFNKILIARLHTVFHEGEVVLLGSLVNQFLICVLLVKDLMIYFKTPVSSDTLGLNDYFLDDQPCFFSTSRGK